MSWLWLSLSLISKIPFIRLPLSPPVPLPHCLSYIFPHLLIILHYLPLFYSLKFFFSPTIIHLSNLDRGQRKEVVEERRVSESERASAPAGVNICFRNLNNRPPVICISDNGQPYGSVDPRCAEVLFFSLSILPCLSFIDFPLTSLISFHQVLTPPIFCITFITYLGTFCSFFFHKYPFSLSVIHKTLDMTHHTELWPKLPW